LAMQMNVRPGSSLQASIKTTTATEKILLANFPEVLHVVSKIGTAEIPTDPMAVEAADIMIILKEKDEWVSATSREALVDKMKAALIAVPWASFEFTQPIQLRFNELMTGAKTDVAIKIFGEDTEELFRKAQEVAAIVNQVPGAGDVKVEQTEGLPQMMIAFDRPRMAQYGLNIEDLNLVIRGAYAGEVAGVVYEDERRFELVVRLKDRQEMDLDHLFIDTPQGQIIPLSEVAEMTIKEGPMQIAREDAKRRISIGVNIRNRDVASFIAEVQTQLEANIELLPGYIIKYGGQFENLEAATKQLKVAVPISLALIFILLFFAFGSMRYAALIYLTVPLAAIGGVVALYTREMPFSISAGVGFIALFGVAVLNGIVLISYFNELRKDTDLSLKEVVIQGGILRLRPVIMTAAVASFGFLPMALSSTAGAEVQKPLATVVIGGLIAATFLTLLVVPVAYYLIENRLLKKLNRKAAKDLAQTT
jgi:cobalt-zinc-cadmium resistance protein CzcA